MERRWQASDLSTQSSMDRKKQSEFLGQPLPSEQSCSARASHQPNPCGTNQDFDAINHPPCTKGPNRPIKERIGPIGPVPARVAPSELKNFSSDPPSALPLLFSYQRPGSTSASRRPNRRAIEAGLAVVPCYVLDAALLVPLDVSARNGHV